MLVFKRAVSKYLEEWKHSTRRKPLILRGARQVGKTTLVSHFSKSYEFYLHLNLEKSKDLAYFSSNNSVKDIIESLLLSHNIPSIAVNKTLLFIDEIQESPEAIQMLRYFHEDFPKLHVIAAGSLLEFAMKKVKSFPVGRVEFLYIHPINFSEFLQAVNQKLAAEQLDNIPVNKSAHKVLLELFNRYTIIGGMPEVVKEYLTTKSLVDLPRIYESIWSTYKSDIEKYAINETERRVLKHIITSAHLYLDQRIKFQNFGNSNFRSREVGQAMRHLNDAKVIQIIYPTTDTILPAKPDLKKSPRLQFLDTGIANHLNGIQADMVLLEDLSKIYNGAIIPHMIYQELISLNEIVDNNPSFWIRDKKQASSEVDLVYAYKGKLIPIEIKSGSSGSLKSLHQFVERAEHPYAIRMYAGEYSIEKAKTPGGKHYLLLNIPYYLGTKIPAYVKYFVDNNTLG